MNNCESAGLTDDAFLTAFESTRYPNEQFRHADHIRLGWIYLRQYGYAAAEARMRESIYRFAASLDAVRKYHTTITIAWMKLIHSAIEATPSIDEFDQFIEEHAWLLNRDTLLAFYSKDLLTSDAAREAWVEPDIRGLAR